MDPEYLEKFDRLMNRTDLFLLDIKAVMGDSVNKIDLIAKIENRTGIDNIDDICTECDGIMIARGDMGVEIPFVELPIIQKALITKCRLLV